jgi:hypothetical protein
MDTLDFLRRVLPSEGYYAIIVINDGAPPQQGFFGSVEELAAACQQADRNGNNTYFAYSSFQNRQSRKQTNVLTTRVLAMDVDCGWDEKKQQWKPYRTQQEGAAALSVFLKDTGLPIPMVVNSGRGLHLYWVLDRDLPPEEWQPLADRIKALALGRGFHIDPTITADGARVLRPTQTHNPKNGAMVDVLVPGATSSVQTIQNLLQAVEPSPALVPPQLSSAPSAVPTRGFGAHRQSKIVGSLDTEFPPRDPAVVIEKCAQIAWGVANQDKVPEPMWYAMLGVAAYCVDPEETAKAWSMHYPGYSETETLRKLSQWSTAATGPATCKKFQDERPKGCTNCPLRDKIRTPASIGARYEEPTEAPTEVLPPEVATELQIPWPFKRGAINGRNVIVQTIDGTDVEIAPFDIYPVGYGRDDGLGYETVRYKWHRRHIGWQDLSFRQAYLNDGNREFSTAIADQGIMIGNAKQLEAFRYMLRSYMDGLRAVKSMTNLHGTMGWKQDFTQFVAGNRIYHEAAGVVTHDDVPVAAGTQRLSSNMFRHAGRLADWVAMTKALDAMPEFAFSVGMGFAAPLMPFTGLNGVAVSLVGKTGAGKTLAQLFQQSIWGDPKELHFAAKFTQNALFSRLGMYNNLPMTVDEATMMRDEEVGDFCYWVTQGRDKARLDRSATEREARTWSTIVTVSTNTPFASKMTASGMETDAQMARLVEIAMPVRKMFVDKTGPGRRLYEFVTTNYGHAGDVYIRHVMAVGPTAIKKRYDDLISTFQQRHAVAFTGAERFWEATFVLFELACQLAQECGLILFDHEQVTKKMLQNVEPQRRAVSDNQQDAFDLVTEYLRKFADQTITVMHTDGGTSSLDPTRIPRGEVRARLDVYRTSTVEQFDRGTVMLITRPFKEWLASMGCDIRLIRRELQESGGDATPADKRFWFGRDTALKYGQFHCTGVRLNHPRMAGFLKDQQQSADDLTFGQMEVVK